MKRINDYFFITNQKKNLQPEFSLCGQLEAIIGNYYLSGASYPESDIQVLYYDSTVGWYDSVPGKKENIVAYILRKENIAFAREDMIEKLKKDTEEYGIEFIPCNSFETDEFYIDREMQIPDLLKNLIWIDDDFMNDENIEFDFESFYIIDSGKKYINPKHFSIADLLDVICDMNDYKLASRLEV